MTVGELIDRYSKNKRRFGREIKMKRYAIVRVDGQCPEYREEDFVCPYPDEKEECLKCEQYRYGDTKEQLIAKVKQAIQIGYNKGIILSDTMAKFIVEFLGVEE